MQALKAVNPIVDLLQLSLELGDIPAYNATEQDIFRSVC